MAIMSIPTIVLGGTGYVAGELLRLIVGHPHLQIVGVMSESQAGQPIDAIFPQLQDSLGNMCFGSKREIMDLLEEGQTALFSAAPHGVSAALVDDFVTTAKQVNCQLSVVDVSADFRYSRAADFEAVYEIPHGAPDLLSAFSCAVPEHQLSTACPHIGHPGCFATALLMAAVPLMKLGIADTDLYAVGITGSTGSGRTPTSGTHHPERHSNLFAYKALEHRHTPEVVGICKSITGIQPELRFIPHSGPFSRGIYVTMQANLKRPQSDIEIRGALQDFYAASPFVVVRESAPRIKDIVGSNYCHIGIAADEKSVAVFVVIDNLVKGAAGGAMQWMNRQLNLAETTGLLAPALAWV
jgi:N-acetyl-gamma-glutamyl-phosphate reductase